MSVSPPIDWKSARVRSIRDLTLDVRMFDLEPAGPFVAPTPGVHGWFWENPGAGRVTVTLKTSGFYTASTEYRDGERHDRTFAGTAGAR